MSPETAASRECQKLSDHENRRPSVRGRRGISQWLGGCRTRPADASPALSGRRHTARGAARPPGRRARRAGRARPGGRGLCRCAAFSRASSWPSSIHIALTYAGRGPAEGIRLRQAGATRSGASPPLGRCRRRRPSGRANSSVRARWVPQERFGFDPSAGRLRKARCTFCPSALRHARTSTKPAAAKSWSNARASRSRRSLMTRKLVASTWEGR